MEDKNIRTRNNGNKLKTVTNTDVISTISIITLNNNGLKIPIKAQRKSDKKQAIIIHCLH